MNSYIRQRLDHIGIGLSLLCALHCSLLPLLLTWLPLWGINFLANEFWETVIVATSFIVGCYSLVDGYKRTKAKTPLAILTTGFLFILTAQLLAEESYEQVLMVTGGLFVAAAHLKNWKALHHQSSVKPPCCSEHHCPNV